MSDRRRLSKLLARALRHQPEAYGLQLDAAGWTPVSAVLAALQQRQQWAHVTEADIEQLVANQTKRRYEMEAGRIRALYGHSLKHKIEKTAALPPTLLYHGTAPASVPLILRDGLKPMRRQYVHLSRTTDEAKQVGRRKAARPVILEVQAGAAHAAGVVFYAGHELIWLADQVPPEFIIPLSPSGEMT